MDESVEEQVARRQAESLERLQRLKAATIDVDSPRPLVQRFRALSENLAEHLAQRLTDAGYRGLRIDAAPDGRSWTVAAELAQAPAEAGSRRVVEALVRMAASFDALYEGWEPRT